MSLIPTSIRLPREVKDALKKEATARRWGVSELIQEILKQWLAWQKKQNENRPDHNNH